MHVLGGTKFMQDFWMRGGWGHSKVLYVKPHQATDHFLKVLKNMMSRENLTFLSQSRTKWWTYLKFDLFYYAQVCERFIRCKPLN